MIKWRLTSAQNLKYDHYHCNAFEAKGQNEIMEAFLNFMFFEFLVTWL